MGKILLVAATFASLMLASCTQSPTSAPSPDTATEDNASATIPPDYPTFPLPAPRPSAKVDLPFTLLGSGLATVGQVDAALRSQLERQGYVRRAYFAVPGGFALATQAERFNAADGKPATGDRRWVLSPTALISWARLADPRQWASAFRDVDPGRYRVIVFLVTTAARTTGTGSVSIDAAEEWLDSGADVLPAAIGAKPLTADSHLTVLVYEFARESVQGDPRFVPDSALDARRHLRGAGLIGG